MNKSIKNKFWLVLLTAFVLNGTLIAQNNKDVTEVLNKKYHYKSVTVNDSTYLMEYEIIDGDTIPSVLLSPVSVVASKERTYIEEYRYQKLKKKVLKVYPYANEVAAIINEIDSVTSGLKKKRYEKKYLKKLEKDLKNNFKEKLKKLTITEGKVLTKLINRQTGVTLHSIIKEYKSGFVASFWNTLAQKYGYSLKKPYDPETDDFDKDVESIVQSLETSDYKNIRVTSTSSPSKQE